MNIKIRREGPRQPPLSILQGLEEYNEAYGDPKVAVVWNQEAVRTLDGWDPRWEIWVQVADNSHPGHRYVTSRGDVVLEDGEVYRFLNTWRYEDGSYAPIDNRLFQALRVNDTWSDRDHYLNNVERPEEKKRENLRKILRDISYGAKHYYRGWDSPVVGPGTKGDWRAKTFWR